MCVCVYTCVCMCVCACVCVCVSAKLLSWCVVYLGYSVPLPWCTKVVYGVRYAVRVLVNTDVAAVLLARKMLILIKDVCFDIWKIHAKTCRKMTWSLSKIWNKKFSFGLFLGSGTPVVFFVCAKKETNWSQRAQKETKSTRLKIFGAKVPFLTFLNLDPIFFLS